MNNLITSTKRKEMDITWDDRPLKRSRFPDQYSHESEKFEFNYQKVVKTIEVANTYASFAQLYEWEWINLKFDQILALFETHISFIHSQIDKSDTGPVLTNALFAFWKRLSVKMDSNRNSLAEKISNLIITPGHLNTTLSSQLNNQMDLDLSFLQHTSNCYNGYNEVAPWEMESYSLPYMESINFLIKRLSIYEQTKNIVAEFFKLVQSSNLTTLSITETVSSNLRYILSQTEDKDTAPILQAVMLALSDRISHDKIFNQNMAFKLMSTARGIFNPNPKPLWSDLPDELWTNVIFPNLFPKKLRDFIHHNEVEKEVNPVKGLIFTSKKISHLALQAHINWMNERLVHLGIYGCKTLKDQIQCALNRNELRSIQLWGDLRKTGKASESETLETENALNILEITRPHISNLAIHFSCMTKFPKFKHLRNLTFSVCPLLTDEILSEVLTHLENLEKLEIAACDGIRGKNLSTSFSKLQKLTHLAIQYKHNVIPSKKIIEAISLLQNLKSLNILGTWLTMDEKSANLLAKLKKLTSLFLTNLDIDDETLKKLLFQLPNLTTLYLGEISSLTTEEFVHGLAQLKNLKTLGFYNIDHITGKRFNIAFNELKYLEELSIIYCNEMKDVVKHLPLLKNLTNLDLSDEILEDKFTRCLAKLKGLRELSLSDMDITPEKFALSLKQLKDLRKLSFSYVHLNTSEDQLLEAISQLLNLKRLELNGTITPNGISKVLPFLRKLKVLK